MRTLAWLALVVSLAACGDDAGNGGNGGNSGNGGTPLEGGAPEGGGGTADEGGFGGAGGSGGTAVIAIPDPGAGADDWTSNGDIGTPTSAWPVGTATMSGPYVEGETSATTGNAFFVFRAGPAMTSFTVFVTGAPQFVHLHDGAGLVFGAEIPKTVESPTGGTWDVTPDSIYVLEVHIDGGAFF